MTQGIGARVEAITQNFSLGPIEQTGRRWIWRSTATASSPCARRDGSTLYTRNGAFTVDDSGYVNDGSDNRLQIFPTDAAGDRHLHRPRRRARSRATNGRGRRDSPASRSPTTARSWCPMPTAANATIGTVALASFIAPTGLKQIGSSNWEATGLSGPRELRRPRRGRLRHRCMSGALERSNVDITEELVGLIAAQRNFQANAKAIDTADSDLPDRSSTCAPDPRQAQETGAEWTG